MRIPSIGVLIVLASLVAVPAGRVCGQARAEASRDPVTVALVAVRTRHLAAMRAALTEIAWITSRLDRERTVDLARVRSRVTAYDRLDRDLALRAALLSRDLSGPGPLAAAVEDRRARVRVALNALASRTGQPGVPPGAFEPGPPPVPPSARAVTGAAVRLNLRSRPTGSLEGLFEASSGVPGAALPARGR